MKRPIGKRAAPPVNPLSGGVVPQWQYEPVPSPLPPVSRRRALLGAAAFAALGAVATACGEPAPRPDVDALTAQVDRARSDSDLAATAATTAPPELAELLTVVAAERTAHARALTDELTRMLGFIPTTTPSASPTTTTSTTSAPKAVTVRDVVSALKDSATSAGELAAQQAGYRAGLLGSISASCTASWLVALGGQEDV